MAGRAAVPIACALVALAAGAETKVNDSPEATFGVVLPGPDGEWIVRWNDSWLGRATARLDAFGNRTYGPASVELLTGSSGGSLVWSGSAVAWAFRVQEVSTNENQIWFQLNDADGKLLKPPVMVYEAPGDRPCCADLAWAEGEYVVGFISRTANGYGMELAMRRVSASGALAGPVIPVHSVPSSEIINSIEVGRTASALVASWYHWWPNGTFSIEMRWFDLAGNPLSGVQTVRQGSTSVDPTGLFGGFSFGDRFAIFSATSVPPVALYDPIEQLQVAPDGSIVLGPQEMVESLSPIGGYVLCRSADGYGIGFPHRASGQAGQIWLRRVALDGRIASSSFSASTIPAGRSLFGASVSYNERGYAVVWGDNRETAGQYDLFFNAYPAYEVLAVGAGPDPAASPLVELRQPETPSGVAVTSVAPYAAGGYGANVGSGDIDGAADEAEELLAGPGPGDVYGPQVRAFAWRGTAIPKVSFYAYGTLRYGVSVSGALLDGDGPQEMLTGAGPGAIFGPHVRGFDYDGTKLRAISKVSFFAYGTLRYGVEVTGQDVEADGYAELVSGPGPGAVFGPQLRGFDYDGGSVGALAGVNTFVYGSGRYGLSVGGGDLDHDLADEIACGPGPDPSVGTEVVLYDYAASSGTLSELAGSRFAGFGSGVGGVTVATCQWDHDFPRELLVSRGPLATSTTEVAAFDDAAAGFGALTTFEPFPGKTHGATLAPVFVGF